MKIEKKLEKKIISWLEINPITYYGDYRDTIEIDDMQQVMDDPLELEQKIWENSFEWLRDCEMELMHELQCNFEDLEKYDKKDLMEYFSDFIHYEVDFVKTALKNTSSVRIRLTVDFPDCVSQYIQYHNSLGNAYSVLSHNSELENIVKLAHGKTENPYYNRVAKLLEGKFTVNSMKRELENCTSEWCKLIFYFKTPAIELLGWNQKQWKKIKIPKSAMCGFYDSHNGAGSLLEIELTEDIWLNRYKNRASRRKGVTPIVSSQIEIILDEHKNNGYSVEKVYGLCNVPLVNLETK